MLYSVSQIFLQISDIFNSNFNKIILGVVGVVLIFFGVYFVVKSLFK